MRLSAIDLKAFCECTHALYQQHDLSTFPSHVVNSVGKLISADVVAYNEINARRRRVINLVPEGQTFSSHQIEAFERHIAEHPLIRFAQEDPNHPAMRISDFVTASQFHHTGLYNEFFRSAQLEYQLAFGISSRSGVVIGISASRGRRDFSDREKKLLELVRPHVSRAYQVAEALAALKRENDSLHHLVAHGGRALVQLDSSGRVRELSREATRLLEEYFPPGRRNRLPETLAEWAQEQISVRKSVQTSPLPLICDRPVGQLIARLIYIESGGYFLLLEERSLARQAETLSALGLTHRESQVLALLSHGKTDPEIARELGPTLRTIKKHVEHIFRKLSVETRIAAAIRARDLID